MKPGTLRNPSNLAALLLLAAAAGAAVFLRSGPPDPPPPQPLVAERSQARVERPQDPGHTTRLASILRETDPVLRQASLFEWIDADPTAAGTALLQMAALERKDAAVWQDFIAQLAARWMARDPAAAIAWIKSLPDGPARMQAEIQSAYQWATVDPEAAAAYSQERNHPRLQEIIASKWSESDPAAAMKWLASLPPERANATATARAAAIWAQSDPTAAAAFAGKISDPGLREMAGTAVVSNWAMTDPAAAGQWLATLADAPGRDRTVDVYCQALDPVNPALAFDWASSISDEDTRLPAIRRATVALAQNDLPAARRKITASPLPEPFKEELLAAIGR